MSPCGHWYTPLASWAGSMSTEFTQYTVPLVIVVACQQMP